MDNIAKLEKSIAAKITLPNTRANLRLPKPLKVELAKLARRRNLSLNELSVRALFSYLKRSA